MTEKKHCCIFVGGAPIFTEGFKKENFKSTDYIIAADSGCAQIERLNKSGFTVSPDLILGDMDSFGKEKAVSLYPNAEYLGFPPEKDYTDTQLAVETAIERGFDTIMIIGGTGNRADHYLANLSLLRKYRSETRDIRIFDGKNMVMYERPGCFVLPRDGVFKYFSLIPDGSPLYGVSISGAKYELENADIDRDMPITVSNEITDDKCVVRVNKGNCFVILCSD